MGKYMVTRPFSKVFLLFLLGGICCFIISLYGKIPQSSLDTFPPMYEIYHPVSTSSKDAQKSFDIGLTYVFAYNHDLAFHEFEKASKFDPDLAMAYWGMALALGQNVNQDVTPENEIRCYNYIQQALKLLDNASPSEQAYIKALATRYTNDPKADLIPLRFRYRDAMKKVMNDYPQDLDAATLYTESILNLYPWKWWTPDGKPKEGVPEAIDILESILKRNPGHVGANHFHIHAWEESPYADRALMSAHRLETLLPESGHLLHMPCHIFLTTGDYESAIKTNTKAIHQDHEYINKYGLSGDYPHHYLRHNMAIQTRIYMLMEDYDNAIKTAFELIDFIKPQFKDMADSANFAKIPLEVYLYFGRWQEILDFKLPVHNAFPEAYLHFSRGVAYANLGAIEEAQSEKQQMLKYSKELDPKEELAQNPLTKIMDIAALVLEANINAAQRKQDDYVQNLRQAIKLQDQLDYDEPPAWYVQIRLELGFELIRQKKFVEAEKEFLKALDKQQRNGRALIGLYLALKGQNRVMDAYWVDREAEAALKFATHPLSF